MPSWSSSLSRQRARPTRGCIYHARRMLASLATHAVQLRLGPPPCSHALQPCSAPSLALLIVPSSPSIDPPSANPSVFQGPFWESCLAACCGLSRLTNEMEPSSFFKAGITTMKVPEAPGFRIRSCVWACRCEGEPWISRVDGSTMIGSVLILWVVV